MFISNIKLKNFRNIENIDLNPNDRINVFIGNNAQGKTNLIESIYFSAFLKSYRTKNKYEIIRENSNYLSIQLIIKKNNSNSKFEYYLSKENKIFKINEKFPVDFNFLNVIIFYPDETNYINNYPLFRRNLIDKSIFNLNYSYLNLYNKYNRCLKQRNKYLKNNKNNYDIWKDQLIKFGSEIIKKRIEYINRINSIFNSESIKKISSEFYFISYFNKIKNSSSIEDILREEFSRKEDRERLLGYTLVGPHRDDISFFLNGRPAEGFASQGQKRSLVISYKTAQILDYKEVQGHYPVLILDDMTSELDTSRKNVLLGNLLDNSGQVFITSTDFRQINDFGQAKVFSVNNGFISVAD